MFCFDVCVNITAGSGTKTTDFYSAMRRGVMRSRLKQTVHIGPPFFVTETEHQYCFNLFSLIETTPIYVGL